MSIIQGEFAELVHWRLIIGEASVIVLLIISIIVESKCQFIVSFLCTNYTRSSNQEKIVANRMSLLCKTQPDKG